MLLTTVSKDHAVLHDGNRVHRVTDLKADEEHEVFGIAFRTLPDLGGLLSKFATVNDVHFGETECGVDSKSGMGPVFRVAEDATPYPEFMNAGAVAEIADISPDAVLVKGDLTCNGTDKQYADFLNCYATAFGDRLYHVRGNHEAYDPPGIETEKQIRIDLPGVTLAMIDTVRPGSSGGTVYDRDLQWLAAMADEVTNPILVFAHHHIWDPATSYRSTDYFGIQPHESEKLIDLVSQKTNIKGFFAGHTHRNRVRYFPKTGTFPWVEIACVKDFPGTWAEYQVFDNGIVQINHRISTPEALDWTEKTRNMYGGSYFDYAFGRLSDRCFVVHRDR
jgi:3',5'-cyclic-AMP phosphodiesterase